MEAKHGAELAAASIRTRSAAAGVSGPVSCRSGIRKGWVQLVRAVVHLFDSVAAAAIEHIKMWPGREMNRS